MRLTSHTTMSRQPAVSATPSVASTTTHASATPDAPVATALPKTLGDIAAAGLGNPLVGAFAACARSLAYAGLALGVAAGCNRDATLHDAESAVTPHRGPSYVKGCPTVTGAPYRTSLNGGTYKEKLVEGQPVDYRALQLSTFDYEALIGLIDRYDVRRIEDLLPRLPSQMLADYTLMRDSNSTQYDASLAEPRVILYGKDASLMLAFTSSPEHAHGYDLEVIQYRAAQRAFEMRNISFSASGERPLPSKANPPECLRCHGSDPRPNWDTYPFWPGAIAGKEDILADDECDLPTALTQLQTQNARLRPLVDLGVGYEMHADQFTNKAHNVLFSGRASRLNFERVARLIQATPDYDKYKYAVLGALLCYPDDVAAWLPPRLIGRHHPDHAPTERPRVSTRFGESHYALTFLDPLFDWRGVSTDRWSTVFEQRHEMQTPGADGEELAYALSKADPSLRPFLQSSVGTAFIGTDAYAFERAAIKTEHGDRAPACEALRESSRAALAR